MNFNLKRAISCGTVAAFCVTTFGGGLLATPAQANAKTWKKVAIGSAAVTGAGLLTHNGKLQTLGALATIGSYAKYRSDKKKENKEAARRRWYQKRYGSRWQSHYSPSRFSKESTEAARRRWYQQRYGSDWQRHYSPARY